MWLANRAEQRVRAQEDVRALRPLAAHEAVLAQQDGAHVLGAAHADHRPAQQVRLEDRPVALPAGAVEARALQQAQRRGLGPLGTWPRPPSRPWVTNPCSRLVRYFLKTLKWASRLPYRSVDAAAPIGEMRKELRLGTVNTKGSRLRCP